MAGLNWCLAFPYCPNEPIRAQAFQLVQAYIGKHFPGVPQYVHSATPVGEPFQRSATRNQLVRQAETAGHEIIVLLDADTLVHPDDLNHMLEWVADGTMRLGKPFHRGVNLPIRAQQALADGRLTWPRAVFADPGAAWVVRPVDWWHAGGMDENFGTVWGGEDSAFNYLFAARGGDTQFTTHPAVKTKHAQPRWRAIPGWTETLHRELVCKHIHHHPELAEQWLAERDRPGIVTEWATRHNIPLPP